MCTDCHVSKNNDNNAIMAQLLMQGTNYVNFIGRYCWVAAGEHGLEAVVVTERERAASGDRQLAAPARLPAISIQSTSKHGGVLEHAHEHPGRDIERRCRASARASRRFCSCKPAANISMRPAATGGLRVFDIAFIDDKAFSERITTAPVSPIGQRFFVPTQYATAVAAPTTIAPDPTRKHRPENHEADVHALYAYLYVADRFEGLILVGAGTLLDGNPLNNFLKRELTFNPGGILCGARAITIVGTYAYICCDAGLGRRVARRSEASAVVTAVLGARRASQSEGRAGAIPLRALSATTRASRCSTSTDLAKPRPVGARAACPRRATSIWPARMPMWPAARRGW